VIIVIGNMLILLLCLNSTSIAFLPKRKIEIAAVIANPISFASLGHAFALSFASLVILFERGEKLVHFIFLLFGILNYRKVFSESLFFIANIHRKTSF
jgi:hypothetical protein